jgi:urea carboxylase-associated protein 2
MNHEWSITLKPGAKWSGIIGKGKTLKFTALDDGANVSMLLFNAKDSTERYNMPDTLKAQHISRLTEGNVLMSDNGRVLASIVEDSLGWHDTLCGCTDRQMTDAKYGATNYQDKRNGWYRNGYDNFTVELVRNGLGPRDLLPPVNLFSKVYCTDDGHMHFVADHCKEGDNIVLRTEMDVLLCLSNTPNPLDSNTAYHSVPVRLDILRAEPIDPDTDICLNLCPENRRAFENTWAYGELLNI